MTKIEIIEDISKESDLSKKDIATVVDSFFRTIKFGIANNEHIELRGFGTFGTKHRKARVARNPRTNKEINIPEHKVPCFKAGKSLKALCYIATKN